MCTGLVSFRCERIAIASLIRNAFACFAVVVGAQNALAQVGTGFTYQGVLDSGPSPYTGNADFTFALFDAASAGTQIGGSVPVGGAIVAEGQFTVTVDFGSGAFNGEARWLEVRVRTPAGSGNPFITLSPRQRINTTPYAQYALNVANPSPFTSSGGNAILATGSVGIGTASPSQPLHVSDNLFATMLLDRVGGSQLSVSAQGSTATIGTANNFPMRISTNNIVRMTFDTSGNVGIGTTTPDGRLDVRQPNAADIFNLYDGGTNVVTVIDGGNVGIGTATPAHTLHVETSTANRAINGYNTGATGTRYGVFGESDSISGAGVRGQANHATGLNFGVHGQSLSTNGVGVYGEALAGTRGVYGTAAATTGIGVEGYASSTTGTTYGLYGRANSADGAGVYASNFNSTGLAALLDGPTMINDSLEVQGDLDVVAPLNATIQSQQDIALDAADAFTVTANSISMDSGTSATLGSASDFTISSDLNLRLDGTFVRVNNTTLVAAPTGVGLGTAAPAFQLHLSNNSAAKPTSSSWTIASDRQLKKNIRTIDGALDDLLALRGVTYQWIDPSSQGGMEGEYTGMIAQEVEQVFPEWITTGSDGFRRLTVIGFEGLAVEALRQLRDEKDREIERLRAENDELRKRMEAIERAVARLQSE